MCFADDCIVRQMSRISSMPRAMVIDEMRCFRFPGQSILLFLDRLLGLKFDWRQVAQ